MQSLTVGSSPVFDIHADSKIDVSGTSFHGVTVTVDPVKLIEFIGDSSVSDDYKISKRWSFVSKKTGAVFTLYDWKETSLYDMSGPSPTFLWYGGRKQINLHIGHKAAHTAEAKELADILQQIATPSRL